MNLNLFSQRILKGKELSSRLYEINSFLDAKQYEKAIKLFESDDEIIAQKKIKKKDVEIFNLIIHKVNKSKRDFEQSSLKIQKWLKLKNCQEYERLMGVFEDNLDQEKFQKKDLVVYKDLLQFNKKFKNEYQILTEKYIETPRHWLSINRITNDYNQAIDQNKSLNNYINIYKSLKIPAGINPKFNSQIEQIKKDLKDKQKSLSIYIKENKPLSKQEIEELFSQQNLSMSEIRKYAIYVEKGYSKILIHLDANDTKRKLELYELADLLNMNVVRYYKLWNTYDSELKIKAFSRTNEYAKLYAKMAKIKEEIKGSFFFMPIKFSCFSNKYDLSKKSFRFFTSELDGFQYGNNTNYMQYGELCLKNPFDKKIIEKVKFGGTDYYFEQEYFIPVNDENIALQLEENCKEINLVFVLQLNSVERKQTALGKSNFIKSRIDRVLFINESDKIYYQKKLN